VNIIIPFAVLPHKRPRFYRGKVYQPKQIELINELIKFKQETNCKLIKENVSLRLFFSYKNNRRIDLDNICKNIFDALVVAKIIKDDAQVYKIEATKMFKVAKDMALIVLEEYNAPIRI
jgi:Holliday junction resolvase RusA-like endonuclease